MNKTAIEWTQRNDGTPGFSANPLKYRRKSDGKVVWGCVKTSPGCANCYAEAIALRFDRGKLFNAKNMEELEPFLDQKELQQIRHAKKIQGVEVSGSRCFLGDMTDIFGEWVPNEMLDHLFVTLSLRQDVTFQLLTKRAARLRDYMTSRDLGVIFETEQQDFANLRAFAEPTPAQIDVGTHNLLAAHGVRRDPPWPLPNVHLGVSVENQEQAKNRITELLKIPAAVHWVSAEPLLSAVDFTHWLYSDYDRYCRDDRFGIPRDASRAKLDWIVAGGESGLNARPCNIEWIRDIVRQCQAASVPVFTKQLGSQPYIDHSPEPAATIARKHGVGPLVAEFLNLQDKKGGNPEEWPSDLRVREFPQATTEAV